MLSSSTSPSTRHKSGTTNSVLYIVHIVREGREAQCGVSIAVGACEKKMFLVADVSGLVWNSRFGSVLS
jgi:hypothetical protein